jgi:hypothetical protein
MLQVQGRVKGLCTSSITTVVGTTRSDGFRLGSYNDSRQVLICEGEGTDSDSSDAAPHAKGPDGRNRRLYPPSSPITARDDASRRHEFERGEGKGAASRVVGDRGRVRTAGGGQQEGRRSGSAPPGGSGESGSGASGVRGDGGMAASIGSGQIPGGSGDGGGRRDGSGRRQFGPRDWGVVRRKKKAKKPRRRQTEVRTFNFFYLQLVLGFRHTLT